MVWFITCICRLGASAAVATTEPPEDFSVFDALRDTIYSEVATLIANNENRPHFLVRTTRTQPTVHLCTCTVKSSHFPSTNRKWELLVTPTVHVLCTCTCSLDSKCKAHRPQQRDSIAQSNNETKPSILDT